MCGIVGAIADRDVVPVLIEGLKRLEYRGYDSAGIAVVEQQDVRRVRRTGRVAEMESAAASEGFNATLGIGFSDAAVGGPASVANTQRCIEAFSGGGGFHFGHPAGTAHPAHVLLLHHGDAGGVVAAVFQPLQPFNQYRYHVAISDRSHNAAHRPSSILSLFV